MANYIKYNFRKILLVITIILFSSSFYFFGKSIYILGKAEVGQILLNIAWEKTLSSQNNIRPWPSADYYPFAQLSIPSGEKFIVLSNTSGHSLAFGPTFFEKSSYPGKKGRSLISMHRDTHGQFLKDLRKGDLLNLKTKEGLLLHYKIKFITIIDSSKNKLQLKSQENELILYTCYPFDSINTGGSMRFVVQAILLKDLIGKHYA